MTTEPPTVGELSRAMDRLSRELAATRAELARLGSLEIQAAVSQARHEQHEERLDDVESSLRWVTRTVLAALIVALVSLVVGATTT